MHYLIYLCSIIITSSIKTTKSDLKINLNGFFFQELEITFSCVYKEERGQ